MIELGDMRIVGGTPPAKLLKACAVIADQLHPTFAMQRRMEHRDKSKESCVLCSLAVRDFLLRIGFPDARVRPVAVLMAAFEGESIVHSLGIGIPGTRERARHWVGHLIVQTTNWLIDTTLYTAIRPQWRGFLTGMLVVPVEAPRLPVKPAMHLGLECLTLVEATADDFEFGLSYLDNPTNIGWQLGPDCEPVRRKPAVRAMRSKFGTYLESTNG